MAFNNDAIVRELRARFGESVDLSLVNIRVGEQIGFLCYLTSLTNTAFLMENIVLPISRYRPGSHRQDAEESVAEALRSRLFAGLSTLVLREGTERLPELLLQGYAALLLDGEERLLLLQVKALETRPISEPTTQDVAKGPKEAFTESAETNMSMIRRRIVNERLRFEKHVIGTMTRTNVYLAFIEGEADEGVVRRLRQRLEDGAGLSMNAFTLEKTFAYGHGNLVPLLFNSERPDTICSMLLDKRVALIVNGNPFVLIAPAVFRDFFHSQEDRYQWTVFGTFMRLLRYVAFLFSLVIPAFYVAVTCFHQELIPTLLLTNISAQREGIPFPAVVEMLLMELTFELLREAGTRMPRLVGQSISIAGALVLGEAAVMAGVVSNITVIVVALTAISGFISPVYTFGANIRLFRYVLIVLGSIVGLYGVIAGCAFLMIHLARIESFGVPYLSPFTGPGRRSPS